MYRILVVAAVSVACLASAGSSATADAPFVGPDCHGIVVSTRVGDGIGVAEVAAKLGLTVQQAQGLVRFVCADVTSNTPRCEVGQEQAANAALERGDFGDYLFHLGNIEACFLGLPPGTF